MEEIIARMKETLKERRRIYQEWALAFRCDENCFWTEDDGIMVQAPFGIVPCPGLQKDCRGGKLAGQMKRKKEVIPYRHLGVPEEFLDVTFRNSRSRESHQRAQAWLKSKEAVGGCLILSGPVDTGKTHLAICLLKEMGARGAMFVFMPEIANRYRNAPFEEKEPLLGRLCSVRLLVLDDLASGDMEDLPRSALEQIVYRRCHNFKATIITTNKHPDSFAAAMGDRIASRLLGQWGRVIFCTVPGSRKRRKEEPKP